MRLTFADIKKKLLDGEHLNLECKEAEANVPKSVYESYSAFANTNGGYIILGIQENKKIKTPDKRFVIQGIANVSKQKEDFWNTINGNKVNVNILVDEDVYVVSDGENDLLVIHVPRADYKLKPVYVGENPYKGTFKRNNEGDYHATEHEVRALIRDQNPDGNDSMILEHYTMEDIDEVTFTAYRQMFQVKNPEHVWNSYDNKEFLTMLGGYRQDRKTGVEGLSMAGLLMFGKGLPIRDEFDNILMDYRDESFVTPDVRWNDRITYDGTWENNLFNFFTKVTRKLTADLKKPFKLENEARVDDTPVHKAVREGFVNLIIHSDYLMDAGVLKVIKKADGFEFTNPGILKLPVEEIYKGGNSRARNPKIQTMLRMVGFGDNAGSGFPAILEIWQSNGWIKPRLIENTVLNQVTLLLSFEVRPKKTIAKEIAKENIVKKLVLENGDKKSAIKIGDKKSKTEINMAKIRTFLMQHGEMRTKDVAEYVGLGVSRTRELLGMMDDVEIVGGNKDRRYRLK